jgi:ABC-type transport system involved in multi-copper enzyme maturation permease subunit
MILLRQFFCEHRLLVGGYSVFLLFNTLLSAFLWPDLKENLEAWSGIAKLLPLKAVQDVVWMIEKEGWWAYFGVQQLFKSGGVIAMTVAGLLGSMLVARDVDQRTAEFLFSRPVSRTQLFLTRWGAGLLFLQIPFFLTTLLFWGIGQSLGESLAFSHVLLAHLHVSLFVTALFTVTAWLSVVSSHQLKPAMLVVGFMLFQLAIYMVQDLWSISIFKMIDLDRILPIRYGDFPWWQFLSFLGTTLTGLFAGIFCINRRDF